MAFTLASFQADGTVPMSKDCWNIDVNIRAIISAWAFSTSDGSPTGPMALCEFILFSWSLLFWYLQLVAAARMANLGGCLYFLSRRHYRTVPSELLPWLYPCCRCDWFVWEVLEFHKISVLNILRYDHALFTPHLFESSWSGEPHSPLITSLT